MKLVTICKVLVTVVAGIFIGSSSTYGQTPIINSIDRLYGPVGSVITISGSGFDTNASNLVVGFGAARGRVLTATETVIEARVPPGATHESVSVTNLVSGKTAYSGPNFTLSFGGSVFDAAKMDGPAEWFSDLEVQDICPFDIDGDNKVDLVLPKNDPSANDILILHNTTSSFTLGFDKVNGTTHAELSMGVPTSFAACADLEGDGKKDLILVRQDDIRNELFILQNQSTPGTIKFSTKVTRRALTSDEFSAGAIKVKDINDDGMPDLVVTNLFSNKIAVFLNTGGSAATNTLAETPQVVSLPSNVTSFSLDVEDLNGDNKPEIITTPQAQSNVYILPNYSANGQMEFGTPVVLDDFTGSLWNVEIGDINNDKMPDIAATRLSPSEDLIIAMNNSTDGGDILFDVPTAVTVNNNPTGLSFGDLNGDRMLDIAVASQSTNLKVVVNNGTSSPDTYDLATNYDSRKIKIVDLNGDARPDVVYTNVDKNTGNHGVGVYINRNCMTPVIRPEGPLTICNNDTIRLFATPGLNVEYVWDSSGVEVKRSNEPFVDVTGEGSYKVTAITDGGACSNASGTVEVTSQTGDVPTTPVIDSLTPACEGSDVTLSATVPSGSTYNWTGPNNFTSTEATPSITGVSTVNAGKYYLTVTVSGCESDPDSVLLEVITPPDATLAADGPTTFCEGGSVTLSTASQTGYSYQWYKDGTAISSATTASYSATTGGAYHVQLTSDAYSCQNTSDTVTVTVTPPPTALFTANDTGCTGDTIAFSNTSTVDGTQTVTYDWTFGDNSSSADQNPQHVYETAGTFTVTLTISYEDTACNDQYSQTITIAESTPFTIEASGDTVFCAGDSVRLTIPGTYSSYSWNRGQTTQTITVKEGGVITASAVNANGCESTDEIEIVVNAGPGITVTPDSVAINPGETVEFTASGAESYVWSPGGTLNDSTIYNPVATPDSTTVYSITGTDVNGCQGMTRVIVMVVGDSTMKVQAPKVFSPNGDGINDFWQIDNINQFSGCKLMIFSRQGNKVYETELPESNWQGWEARFEGRELPEGAYFFVVSCTDNTTSTGSITVVR